MARLINKPIRVETYERQPQKIFWNSREVLIQDILEHWKDTGCWWESEGEKDFYRIVGSNQRLWEIFYDGQINKWFLYKIYD